MLAASVSISWVFAKSIQNVSLLGAQYGLVGCAAYGESDNFICILGDIGCAHDEVQTVSLATCIAARESQSCQLHFIAT